MADTLTTDIAPAHLQGLGRLTVHFELLSHGFERLIWELLKTDSAQATAVTAQLNFKTLVAVAATLYRQRVTDPERLANLDRVTGAALNAEGQRNTLIHSTWIGGARGEDPWRMKMRADREKGLVFHSLSVPIADIEAVSTEISTIAFDVLKLETEFQGEQG